MLSRRCLRTRGTDGGDECERPDVAFGHERRVTPDDRKQ